MREQLLGALLHVGRSIPPPGFVQFWSKWRRPVFSGEPALVGVEDSGAGVGGVGEGEALRFGLTHILRGGDGVRLGVRLTLPEGCGGAGGVGSVRGVVITTHGYAVGRDEPIGAAPVRVLKRGLAVLSLRVRGYPGSAWDVPDWSAAAGGWIAQRIDDLHKWSLPGGVGDVIAAFRAARAMFGQAMPISLHGESFGGALAILAASQLSGRGEVSRMVLGVPTMGDWNWRLANSVGSGLESDVRGAMERADGEGARAIRSNLRLFDTVVHAKRVVCPVVMKIAGEDPVVPPHTVAAIYNALGSAPGTKWRFLVGHGHTPDLPGADVRRHALFERLGSEFLDSSWGLEGMRAWEGRMDGGGGGDGE
ncbi:MAG: acetylxylan esterase [Phycisphaerales bacterium]